MSIEFDCLHFTELLFELFILFEELLVFGGKFHRFLVHFFLDQDRGTISSLVEDGLFLARFSMGSKGRVVLLVR